MIRWRYAAPRLVVVATVLAAVYLGLNPLIRWGLESLGEQVFSTPVDIGNLNASLRKTELRIDHFAVASPSRSKTNLIQADEIQLSLEPNALLRRKFVVKEGVIRGLQIDSDREEVAQAVDHWQWNPDTERLQQSVDRWLAALSQSLGERLEAEVDSLESVRLAKELLESWPEEYQQLEARVREVKARIEAFRTLVRTQPQNVAAGIQLYQKTLVELQQLQQEMAGLAEQVDALPNRIESDRDAILAATERDMRALEHRFKTIQLDQDAITAYLLGPEMGRRVTTIAQWIRWIRSHLPNEEPESTSRLHGVNVLFAGTQPKPDFLVESLHIDGQTRIAGRPYNFIATATGLTTQPRLYGRPAEIRAQLAGDVTVEVYALLNRAGERPLDQIVVNCPNLNLPETSLGRKDAVTLAIRPGNTHLWMSVTLSGDQISGSLLLKQSDVELTPTVAESLGGRRVADSLTLATQAFHEIEIQVDLAGPLDRPNWVVRSNLGVNLKDGFNRAALAELEFRRTRAMQLVQERVDKELNKFRNRLATDEEILLTRLKLSETETQQLTKLVTDRIPSADKILTRAVRDQIPLRF